MLHAHDKSPGACGKLLVGLGFRHAPRKEDIVVCHRFGFAAVVVLGMSLLGSFGAGFPPKAAAAAAQQSINAQVYAPHQAIVFDGSADASSTYLVALSTAGFLTQILQKPLDCDQVIHQAQWAIQSVGFPGTGISIPGAFHFDFQVFPRPPGPNPIVSPFDPAVLRTDCDVLADFTAVQKYL